MSNIKWNTLSALSQLDEIDKISESRPVLLFKHSIRCSISAATLNRFEAKWDNAASGDVEPFYLDLINHRDISNEITSRYGVTHQSPQAIIISHGKAVYDNSHFGISFQKIAEKAKLVSA